MKVNLQNLVYEAAEKLASREYYDTVAYGYICEAIENSIEDGIDPRNINELDKHIKTNYI